MKHDATISRRRGPHAALAFAIATALATSYALPAAQQAPVGSAQSRPAAQSAAADQAAPAKKVLTVADYPKWRTISGQEISGDGNWVGYGQSLTNTVATETKPVLHLVRVETQPAHEVPNATGGVFSADSKWIAYQVDPTGGRGGRGGRGGAPGAPGTEPSPGGDTAVPPSAPGGAPPANPAQVTTPPGQNPQTTPTQPAQTPPQTPPQPPPAPAPAPAPAHAAAQRLRALRRRAAARTRRDAAGDSRRVSSCAISRPARSSRGRTSSRSRSPPNSTHLILRRRPATAAGAGGGRGAAAGGETPAPAAAAAGGGGAAATPPGPRGTDVILHNLVTGRDQLLGSVGDIAFNKSGDLLAYTVDASVKDGNGLFVIDLKTNRLHTLDNDARPTTGSTWSDDGTALAVLKGSGRREDARARQRAARVRAASRRRSPTWRPRRSRSIRRRPPGSRKAGSSAIAPRSTGATTTSASSSAPRRRCPRPIRRRAAAPTSSPTSTSGTRPTSACSRSR